MAVFGRLFYVSYWSEVLESFFPASGVRFPLARKDLQTEPVFVDLLRGPVPEIIDPVFSKTSPKRSFSMTEQERFGLVFTKTRVYKFGHRYRFSAWRAGTKPYLSYWPARLHRLAKSIPRNRCLGSINFYKYGF
jgi:hypothetical protein